MTDAQERWLGEFIAGRYTELGMSQAEFARRSGFSDTTIREIERGDIRRRRPATLTRLSLALDLPANALQRILAGETPEQVLDDAEHAHPSLHGINLAEDLPPQLRQWYESLSAGDQVMVKRLLAWVIGEKVPQAVSAAVDDALQRLATTGRRLIITTDWDQELGLAADAEDQGVGEIGPPAARPGPEPNE